MTEIRACGRSHRYRSTMLRSGLWTTCPRCNQLLRMSLAFDRNPCGIGTPANGFKSQKITDPQEACELLSVVSEVGSFRAVKVWSHLRPLFGKLAAIQIGREAGPVIWAFPPYKASQSVARPFSRPGRQEQGISQMQRCDLIDQFIFAMARAGANELYENGHLAKAGWRP